MRITLGKARRLREELESVLAGVGLPLSVEISVLVAANREHPLAELEAGAAALAIRKDHLRRISRTVRALRVNIARESVAAHVENHAADIADLDLWIAMEKAVVEADAAPVEEHLCEEVRLRYEALRAPGHTSWGKPATTVDAPVVTPAMRAAALVEMSKLRRVRDQVEARLRSVEAEHDFEIDEEDASLLREMGLA